VNAADVSGYTALICAAHRGRAEVVTLLLAADGIDVNAEDSRRKTALQYASAKGHAAAVELLRRKRPRK
jgi:ankyrin repeat protein